MGRTIKFLHSRTALALVLTIAALVVPCAAWYVLGMREVQRFAAQIEGRPTGGIAAANDQYLALSLRNLQWFEPPFLHPPLVSTPTRSLSLPSR